MCEWLSLSLYLVLRSPTLYHELVGVDKIRFDAALWNQQDFQIGSNRFSAVSRYPFVKKSSTHLVYIMMMLMWVCILISGNDVVFPWIFFLLSYLSCALVQQKEWKQVRYELYITLLSLCISLVWKDTSHHLYHTIERNVQISPVGSLKWLWCW